MHSGKKNAHHPEGDQPGEDNAEGTANGGKVLKLHLSWCSDDEPLGSSDGVPLPPTKKAKKIPEKDTIHVSLIWLVPKPNMTGMFSSSGLFHRVGSLFFH